MLASLLPWAGAHAGEMYTWKDAHGVTHYADRAPENAQGRAVRMRAHSSAVPAKPAEAPAPAEAKGAHKTDALASNRPAMTKGQKNCEAARERLRTLESGLRLVRVNDKGEQEFMSDADRTRDVAETRKSVTDWCGAE